MQYQMFLASLNDLGISSLWWVAAEPVLRRLGRRLPRDLAGLFVYSFKEYGFCVHLIVYPGPGQGTASCKHLLNWTMWMSNCHILR